VVSQCKIGNGNNGKLLFDVVRVYRYAPVGGITVLSSTPVDAR
jgi:hypothetical protein